MQYDHADRAAVQLDHRDDLHEDHASTAEAFAHEPVVCVHFREERAPACVERGKQPPSRVSRQTTCVLEHLLQQTVPTTLGMPTRGVPIVVQHGGLSTEEKQQLDELGIPTLRGKHQRSDASCEARINFRVAGTVAACDAANQGLTVACLGGRAERELIGGEGAHTGGEVK